MMEMASQSQSQSPSSQISSPFNSNWMQSTGNISLQQRGLPSQSFQPPPSSSSMSQSFQMGNLTLQHGQNQNHPPPQGSPNASSRNMFTMPRGILQLPGQNVGVNQIKRPGMPTSSSILSSSSSSSSMSTMSFMSAFNRQNSENTPSLDLSEFPTLGNRASGSNPTPRNYDWKQMIWKDAKPQRSQEQAPEFQIQQEDFPALPGAQNPPTSTATENGRKSPASSTGSFGPYDQALRDSRQGLSNNNQKRGLQTLSDGTVTNIPAGMVTDQFGMAGLLTFIRAAETDPNLVALNPGIDLTTLGLNLTSMDNLYSTFQSPWADGPCRPQDIDFHVPSEYLTNIFIREKLAPIKLNRYGDDLLFFLFYMNGNDVLQLAAAAELYNRDWRCHKDERVWITRAQGMEPVVKTHTYERGTYYYFDVNSWRRVAKEFHLEYDKLEERPHLPANLAPTPATPPSQQAAQQPPASVPPQSHMVAPQLHNAAAAAVAQQQQQAAAAAAAAASLAAAAAAAAATAAHS